MMSRLLTDGATIVLTVWLGMIRAWAVCCLAHFLRGGAVFVRADHVREGAVVIDVGISRVEDAATERGYRLVGDVAFDEVSKKATAITPVPGGVGPMTIAMLMSNKVKAARQWR
jgi:5,10-methylene-tetrahydrofolate dehydrogenase/methenyl tetrahydrofolate cyclohydrolase